MEVSMAMFDSHGGYVLRSFDIALSSPSSANPENPNHINPDSKALADIH
jgi:hypothetical protein